MNKNTKEYDQSIASYKSFYNQSGFENSIASTRTFEGFYPNTDVKSEYKRTDYEYFRQAEKIPKTDKGIISACNKAYHRVGIVRNIIDLMGDFSCQGIRLEHENPKIERFFKAWFKKVNGVERSERFLNLLYRLGNVVVYKSFAKLNKSSVNKMYKTIAGSNLDPDIEILEERIYKNKTVPLKYNFLCPTSLEVIDKEISNFTGVKSLALLIPPTLKQEIQKIIRSKNKERLKMLPKQIVESLVSGSTYVNLDMARVETFFYKKDDWDDWAKPVTYAILDDLILLEKMKLADASALDGAISNVRLWTLGIFDGPENSILPTKKMMTTLRNILANNVGGGTLDLVWGPELSFKESNTNVHQFLGPEKYTTTLDSIYDGLGIPSALRSGGKASTVTGFIGLKTLVEKLEYGRSMLLSFWEKEIQIVCDAMGFNKPPSVVFDQMIISDEAAEKQLLLHLLDRDIISEETIRQKFDIKSNIEKSRINRERRKRGKTLPHKASPFHSPHLDHDLKKIILQSGGVAPSELGIELLPRKEGEKSKHDLNVEVQKARNVKTETVTDMVGRPKNVTETDKRKPKPQGKPAVASDYSFFDLMLWAQDTQKKISEKITPVILNAYGKTDTRYLTKPEVDALEKVKASILFSIDCYDKIDDRKIFENVGKSISSDDQNLIQSLINRFVLLNDRQPTIDELRQIRASAYALKHEE